MSDGWTGDNVRLVPLDRTRHLDNVLGLRTLLAEVIEGNEASIRMLEAVGYQRTGVVPGLYWKRGAWRSATSLYCRREHWEAATSRAAAGPSDGEGAEGGDDRG